MAHNRMRPIHPREVLREEYLERRSITPDTALRLARYFGGDAASWMNLQVAHDLRKAELESGARIRKEIEPRAA